MDIEKMLVHLGDAQRISSREEMIKRTVKSSEEVFFKNEENRLLRWGEFLLSQAWLIQKRWWLLQMGLLMLLWSCLPAASESDSLKRIMGIAACAFVILMIPELWKNRASGSMEIEASAYYSLRRVYAARMLLFGMADIILAASFCAVASVTIHVALYDMLTQFLFPMAVTACICFALLSSIRGFSETAAVVMCILWSGIWLLLTLNDDIFEAVSPPIWAVLFMAAAALLGLALYRAVASCNKYLEVKTSGTEYKQTY